MSGLSLPCQRAARAALCGSPSATCASAVHPAPSQGVVRLRRAKKHGRLRGPRWRARCRRRPPRADPPAPPSPPAGPECSATPLPGERKGPTSGPTPRPLCATKRVGITCRPHTRAMIRRTPGVSAEDVQRGLRLLKGCSTRDDLVRALDHDPVPGRSLLPRRASRAHGPGLPRAVASLPKGARGRPFPAPPSSTSRSRGERGVGSSSERRRAARGHAIAGRGARPGFLPRGSPDHREPSPGRGG